MNYSKQIFEMLGVEPYEQFKLRESKVAISKCKGIYFIDEFLSVFKIKDNTMEKSDISISDLLLEVYDIKKFAKLTKEMEEHQNIAIEYAKVCGYHYLAKNRNGVLMAYVDKPIKLENVWYSRCFDTTEIKVCFPNISWEDEEPYFIG